MPVWRLFPHRLPLCSGIIDPALLANHEENGITGPHPDQARLNQQDLPFADMARGRAEGPESI